MQAGSLRHRVTLQEPVESTDSFGDPVLSWQDVGEFWARVEPLSGRELEVARAARSDVSHRVTLRGGCPIAPRHRLVFRGRVLHVAAALDLDERRRTLTVLCAEVVDGV